jgi:hypothetical protein
MRAGLLRAEPPSTRAQEVSALRASTPDAAPALRRPHGHRASRDDLLYWAFPGGAGGRRSLLGPPRRAATLRFAAGPPLMRGTASELALCQSEVGSLQR